jgi:hypothetical protein
LIGVCESAAVAIPNSGLDPLMGTSGGCGRCVRGCGNG